MDEQRMIKIGDSYYIIVPAHFNKVYNLNKFIYYMEVSQDGKTITYKRMRKDENLKNGNNK